MLPPTLGDMSSYLSSRHSNVRLKQDIQRFSNEMTTGRADNTSRHLGGDMSQLGGIEHDLRLAETLRQTISEAMFRASSMQSAMQSISERLASTSETLASSQLAAGGIPNEAASANAEASFRLIVSALNTQAGHQSLFSGSAVDQPALADVDTILSSLRTALSGQTTLTGVDTILDAWFDDPGGGFETVAYLGDSNDPPAYQLSADVSVSPGTRADDAAFRNALKATAKAVLATDETLGFSSVLTDAMLDTASDAVFNAKSDLISVQANLGSIEERMESASVTNAARKTALEVAKNELLGVDSFEAASQLEETQFRLESLYAVTARLSRLSLLEYLR